MATILASGTPVDGVSISEGQAKEHGSLDVHGFERIRVVADEGIASATRINISLTIKEGNELIAQLDLLQLAPPGQVMRVYEVPGTKLTILPMPSGAPAAAQ
jgi:hypothetical protein